MTKKQTNIEHKEKKGENILPKVSCCCDKCPVGSAKFIVQVAYEDTTNKGNMNKERYWEKLYKTSEDTVRSYCLENSAHYVKITSDENYPGFSPQYQRFVFYNLFEHGAVAVAYINSDALQGAKLF